MFTNSRTIALAVLTALVTCGCGNKEALKLAAAVKDAAQTAAVAKNPHDDIHVCDLITNEEMSQILGGEVVGTADGNNGCRWQSASSATPFAELKIDWGAARAAMTATGILEKAEPGITGPYDDLGDRAVAVGPMVWIKKGEDLIQIYPFGAGDYDTAVRRIYQLAVRKL